MSAHKLFLISLFFSVDFLVDSVDQTRKPHIVFIIADDLGYNDVGFHGSAEIPTPNIDALAYSGLILNNYYVNPICTPSRSALMTGKYPIHTGMQHGVLYGIDPRGLPLTEKLFPQYLQELGYINHIVGKWHLGSWKREYTPLYRGFATHLGYWTGHQDYFDHTAVEKGGWGLDMRRNLSVAYDLHGQYSTDIFTEESVRLINKHDINKPMFLYLAHAATHSGNPYNPLPAPDEEIAKFRYIEDYNRQRFAGMLSKLDASVGSVVTALEKRNMLNNSIIIFITDNGGAAAGFNLNAASNYPLKGVKNTLWEGGVKGAACVWSPMFEKPSRISTQLMQIVDWLPTLLVAAGGNTSDISHLDGISIWEALSKDETSPRTEILHNIDDIDNNAALMIDNWKLVKGTTYDGNWDNWYGPSGREYDYNISLVENSPAGAAFRRLKKLPDEINIKNLRNKATVSCDNDAKVDCFPLKSPCLFDILNDPCEYRNLADEYTSRYFKEAARAPSSDKCYRKTTRKYSNGPTR
ncbi:arylsulfatase B isoform X2 [Anthonomus grandis grandis]|uniref:arylsulfatase B isoform X2 n=1 Tax=Anthonomus grandis grandis TaxID=2921223 RepID=UPI002165BA25|nr:arylsulfatase B isoform X2 [Anthonomus grandis grandis]